MSGIRRFYEKAVADSCDGRHSVKLDGRAIQTPAKAPMVLPTRALAATIAEEWAAQGETVEPRSMPMMRLAASAIDRVTPSRDAVVDEIAAYAATDHLCYRADGPETLIQRQAEAWQPWLDWATDRFDARLEITAGVVAIEQDPAARVALRDAIAAYDDYTIVALHSLTTVFGSVILALAVVEGEIGARDAFVASRIDEDFQAEQWGTDEAAEAQRAALEAEIGEAARLLALLQAD